MQESTKVMATSYNRYLLCIIRFTTTFSYLKAIADGKLNEPKYKHRRDYVEEEKRYGL